MLRLLLFTKRKTQPTLDRAVNKNRKSAFGRAKVDQHTFSEISPSDNAECVNNLKADKNQTNLFGRCALGSSLDLS